MCPECARNKQLSRCKHYKANNKEKVAEYNKQWKSNHREEVAEYNKKYAIENHTTIRVRKTAREKVRRHTEPAYKAAIVVRNRFRKFYTGTDTSNKCVGIPIDEFIDWLEFQFSGDMDWSNHGTLWHIDHVVPCVWFDFEIEAERRACFHWSNMRPLLATKNMGRKGCSRQELLFQEIRAKNFKPGTNFEPLTTKLQEKSCGGGS